MHILCSLYVIALIGLFEISVSGLYASFLSHTAMLTMVSDHWTISLAATTYTCGEGEAFQNGTIPKCWSLQVDEAKWKTARDTCVNLNASLAEIHDEETYDFMKQQLIENGINISWIGGSEDGKLKWKWPYDGKLSLVM